MLENLVDRSDEPRLFGEVLRGRLPSHLGLIAVLT